MSTIAERYRDRRLFREKFGVLGFWGGAMLLLVDMTTPFPTPVRGAYAMWWLLVVLAGGVMWLHSRRLPVEETLRLAEQHGGELTLPVLSGELGLPVEMASKTLGAMVAYGEAEEIETGQSCTWFFFNTNRRNTRLMRVIDMARHSDGRVAPEHLVTANIAHDLLEAEAMLTRLAQRGYIEDWRKG